MKLIMRSLSTLLLAWFAFVAAAAVFTAFRKREAPAPPEPDANEVDLVASFEPLEFASTAPAFRGGTVTTWFGGGVLDLRDAHLDPAGATLNLSALFGGGQLVVPEDWNVTTRVVGIGGVGDGRSRADRPADAPHLTLEGVAVFGGWGITSAAPGEAHAETVTA